VEEHELSSARETISSLEGQAASDATAISGFELQQQVDREVIDHLVNDGVADRDKIAQLEEALVSCRRIGAAMGILMERRKITVEAAFELLKVRSQNTHRKLRDVADDLLFSGDLGN
jgi:hypothetical protein